MDFKTSDPYLTSFLRSLIKDRFNTVNVYKRLTDVDSILSGWRAAVKEPGEYICQGKFRLHYLYDVDSGVTNTLSKLEMERLVEVDPALRSLPVLLRYQHGNLFSFLLQELMPEAYLLTDRTTVIEEMTTGLFRHAKIGNYTPHNRLYHGKLYDGVESTLGETLKSRSFVCYSIATRDMIQIMDLPH